jgi:arsenite-transporting ATPase
MSSALFPLMNWVQWQTPFLFFTGKGGVGKTTVAATVAVQLAQQGQSILLVSTDPASNLDDVFEMTVAPSATPVPGVEGLTVLNIDPEAAAAAYREQVIGPYRGLLPASALHSMEEQLSGACTVEIAAFNTFTRLLVDAEIRTHYRYVIFDTAPTGHTLRLLTLPSAWSGYIAANQRGASCLGPLAGLEAQREQYNATVQALTDATQTTLVLVSRPEVSALREAQRSSHELQMLGMLQQQLVLNGVFSVPGKQDALARAFATRQQDALQSFDGWLQGLPVVTVPLVASNLTGIAALRALAEVTSQPGVRESTAGYTSTLPDPPFLPGLHELVQRLATDGHGVILTMGKGGVGKTTLAAALAVALAAQGFPVHLSTTDPAAHLAQAIGADRPRGLTVNRIDPAVEVQRYTEEVLTAAGELSSEDRALLEEDLRSPCTEEIAVFRAFAQTVHLAEESFVVLDTAPTGHTLLLLDTAENYHREVTRTTGHAPLSVQTLLPRLRDAHYTKILLVTLAESTPVQEAERLQADLRRAGLEPFGWVINASLSASDTHHPLLVQRAQLEQLHIRKVVHEHASRIWLVPWYEHVPAGETALLAMTTS